MLPIPNVYTASPRVMATSRIQDFSMALRKEFDTLFKFYDGSTGDLVDAESRNGLESPLAPPPPKTRAEIVAVAASGLPRVRLRNADRYRLLLPIQEADGRFLVATSDLRALARSPHDSRLERARLQKWLKSVQSQLSFTGSPQDQFRMDSLRLEQLRTLLEASRELNDLLGASGILGESSTFANRILERIADVLAADTLVWVPAFDQEPVVIAGDPILSTDDCGELTNLLLKRSEWEPAGYLILNDLRSCGLAARFPTTHNLLAFSVEAKDHGGCLLALNKRDAAATSPTPESDALSNHGVWLGASVDEPNRARLPIAPFRRIDAAAAMPFAALLALQARGSRRQSRVQDLFAGLIRSLTAAIDAKDSYTRGHSERVARVAVEIGRELHLPEAKLADLYFAGLLHDIGKIGVPDSILCKHEPLTPEEILRIRQHVSIGCRILEQFREISHLLPLVLHHHERHDGAGYPHGLRGEAIPLLARILAVADSYDAMNTSRSYRNALSRDQIERSLKEGQNRQWDPNVVDAFFRAKERIYAIQERGIGDSVWMVLHSMGEEFSP